LRNLRRKKKKMKKFKKFNEELNLASGTEMMKASQMRTVVFNDKTKYNRKVKHKKGSDNE
jgi:hypothetical protein